MIFIWRGWGMLALVVLFPMIATCAGMIEDWPMGGVIATTCAWLLLGGAVCVHFGTRWNRHGVEHSLYFVPLEVWGWVYLGIVFLVSALFLSSGLVRKDLKTEDRAARAVGGALGMTIVGGGTLLYLRRPKPPAGDNARARDGQ